MPNLRIIYNNATDRATLTASSEVSASMAVGNLYTDIKADIWRSVGTSATITATWTVTETIGGVILPFCNFTSQATIRVRGYSAAADLVPLFDTAAVEAAPAPVLGLWDWGAQSLGSNAYAYGGGTAGRVWIPTPGAVKKIVIDIADPTNTYGYIEAGRLVCGAYWSPEYNADSGAPVTPADTSKHYRTEAGNLLTDIGTRHRKQSISLSAMTATDRATLWDILWVNGMSRPLLFSLYPNDADAKLEQTHQLYCKLGAVSAMATPYFQRYATSLDLEEV